MTDGIVPPMSTKAHPGRLRELARRIEEARDNLSVARALLREVTEAQFYEDERLREVDAAPHHVIKAFDATLKRTAAAARATAERNAE